MNGILVRPTRSDNREPGVYFRLWPLLLMERGPLRHWGIALVRNETKRKEADDD